MLYEFATTVAGLLRVSTDQDVERLAHTHGRDIIGRVSNPRLRPELQGQPRISRMHGPMWGGQRNGEAVIRYEDAETYNGMST